jgi:5-methylcytosine-specific restriction endonuclease McrA
MPKQYKPWKDEEYNTILKMFHGRCIRCEKYAVCVHEIVFKAEGKKSHDINNRIPLCSDCHDWVHYSDKKGKSQELLELRAEVLKRYETS